MGLFWAKMKVMFDELGTVQARILMLGLDAAGKSTILYKAKMKKVVCTIPTTGFNVETVSPMKGLTFTVWDVAGQDKVRPLWRHYYQNTDGLIYVVDSSDRERMTQARDELYGILENDEMKGVPVVVIANKQDLPSAMKTDQIVEHFDLQNLRGRKWYIQAACAVNGEGIFEGMNQLASMVKEFKKEQNTFN